jgi:hypothetical protein
MSIKLGDDKLSHIYKYRPLVDTDGKSIYHSTLRLLKFGELFFSKPSLFNDPFDSKVDYDTTATDDEINKYLVRIGFGFKGRNNLMDQIKKGVFDPATFAPEGGTGYADLAKIYCLSKDEKNILMWSHYAKDHTGICIGIRTHIWGNSLCIKVKDGYVQPIDGNTTNFLPLIYVEYNEDKPTPYKFFTGPREDLSPFFISKSKLWEYENEMRLIIPYSCLRGNPVCIDTSEIGEIIFGLKTPANLIREVKEIVSTYPDNGKNTSLYKCVEVKGKYAIDKIGI